jgi:hypothetical protein
MNSSLTISDVKNKCNVLSANIQRLLRDFITETGGLEPNVEINVEKRRVLAPLVFVTVNAVI